MSAVRNTVNFETDSRQYEEARGSLMIGNGDETAMEGRDVAMKSRRRTSAERY
jgi:hypothetical protein